MKPAPFAYYQAATIDEALAILAEHGDDAKVLAGGQSLLPMMNLRLATPAHVVDINGISELTKCSAGAGGLRLGALTRHCQLERSATIRDACPLLAQAVRHIAHPQIRTRGTVGGSLAHADPSAELPGVMAALDAEFVIRGPLGERSVPAVDFFLYFLTTVLAADEMLVAIKIPPKRPRQGSAFTEVAARFGDFALAGAAVVLTIDPDGIVDDARIACIAAGSTPIRATNAEATLLGRVVDKAILAEVSNAVSDSVTVEDGGPKASASYRKRTAGVLAARAVHTAYDLAKVQQ